MAGITRSEIPKGNLCYRCIEYASSKNNHSYAGLTANRYLNTLTHNPSVKTTQWYFYILVFGAD